MSKFINEEELLILNNIELFLKKFLEEFPEYRTSIVGSSNSSKDEYEHLIHILESKWSHENPSVDFFLKGSANCISEDFFIPAKQNVSVIKNLRYMPLLLHSHQFIEINYIIKSDNSLFIDPEKSFLLEDGDIILCPPNLSHTFKTQNENSIIIDILLRVTTFDTVFFNLLDNNNYLSSLFTNAMYSSSNGYIVWHCKDDIELRQLILSAYDECYSSEKYSNKMLELIVMEFFLKLMRHHENEAIFSIPYMNNSDEQFRALLNYMRSHYQTITLPKLAMTYNYSERQVIRLLKKHSGKSFTSLLLEIRMNKAIQMLKNPDLTISAIASSLGYSNKSYFIKVFKNTFTFTPEAFRERYKSITDEK